MPSRAAMGAGTQNAVGHTVASLIFRTRRYASLVLKKVLLTRPPRPPSGIGRLVFYLYENRI
jgi:hypothetical protein